MPNLSSREMSNSVETIGIKCQILFSEKKKKNIYIYIYISHETPFEFVHRVRSGIKRPTNPIWGAVLLFNAYL